MESDVARLRRAVAAFRREQASGYLQALLGRPEEGAAAAARRWLCSQAAREALEGARSDGLSAESHGALAAHMARAAAEQSYAASRLEQLRWPRATLSLDGAVVSVSQLVREWRGAQDGARREVLLGCFERCVADLWPRVAGARDRALAEAGQLLGRLDAPRHPDAGPEGGARAVCAAFLEDSDDLTAEATAVAARQLGVDPRAGGELLWCWRAASLDGLFRGEGRWRRVAADWEPLGLRRALARAARVEPPHPGVLPVAHVLPLEPPRDVRVSLSDAAWGLDAELAAAEGVGRAVCLAAVSPALPTELRHPTVGSVARCVGALGALWLASPLFLRRARGLDRGTAERVARAAAWSWLLRARLAAAQVLAMGAEAAEAPGWVARALKREIPHNTARWLAVRLSPGGAARALVHAPGVAWALRERFDEDWFRNPRAAEVLRGAAARGGGLAVEGWAEELGCAPAQGLRALGELF